MSALNSVAKAELIGTYLETLGYGVYLVVFYKCLQILAAKYTEGRPTAILLCTAFAIFSLVTVHWVMDILRAVEAFTSHMDVPNAAILYYSVVRRDLDLIKSGCYVAATIVADGLIMYRTYIVWARNWKFTLLPFLLVLADIGTGTYAVWLLCMTKPGDNVLLGEVTLRVRWFYAITLAVNVLCSGLISYKIWQVQQEVDRYSSTNIGMRPNGSRIILTIIESAAVYSALLLILIVTSVVGTPVTLAMLNVIAPCIGIVFSMVIVCVSVDRTRWGSLKITTHLNFVSGLNLNSTSGDLEASPTEDKVKMEHHVQGEVFPYAERAGAGSTASLPDLFD